MATSLLQNNTAKGKEKLNSPFPFFFLYEVVKINILAIDQARNGAWSVFNNSKKELVGYGTFSFDNKLYSYSKVILHIEELISSIIKAYDIKYVSIEDIQLRVNVQAFKKLAQLQGVLVNLCERSKLKYGLVAPTQWQNFCKDKNKNISHKVEVEHPDKKNSKKLSLQFIKDKFDIDTDNDNLADAICIGYYTVNNIKIN